MPIPKTTKRNIQENFKDYKFGFKTKTHSFYEAPKGLNKKTIEIISNKKNEPKWMLDIRLQALEIFNKKQMPTWGANLSEINFDELKYYIKAQDKTKTAWNKVAPEIKEAFETLGIPEAEKNFLSGISAQFESEAIYESVQEALSKQGVIFESTDLALKNHPEFFKEYFGKIVPSADNKFAALNTAVWSGGTFIYVPKNIKITLPLQAYFRMNAESTGQFERTLIIADEGSDVHYVEGCTAPISSKNSLHAAVVEIIVKKNAKVKYTTLQDWAHNIYNLVTKRSFVYENGEMIWIDCNMGSKITMKYPAIFLMGNNSKGEIHSLAISSKNQEIDAGAKIIHIGQNSTSKIVSKSISKDGGISSYRGLVKISKNAINSKNHTSCDALILDDISQSNTFPKTIVDEKKSKTEHEATVSKISDDQLFYLETRGVSEKDATSMIINGFAEPIVKNLPMEYAVELNRLLELEMTGSVG
ncbi:MAG: Fe-S cluster assembly protein SufB [Candidatus Gracilibacteria bacterium]|jgi:Fe-S cluster assembly protein SufB